MFPLEEGPVVSPAEGRVSTTPMPQPLAPPGLASAAELLPKVTSFPRKPTDNGYSVQEQQT